MLINNININSVTQNKGIQRQSNLNLYSPIADTVSFSGAKKIEKAPIKDLTR